jgi:hypothetical protein
LATGKPRKEAPKPKATTEKENFKNVSHQDDAGDLYEFVNRNHRNGA